MKAGINRFPAGMGIKKYETWSDESLRAEITTNPKNHGAKRELRSRVKWANKCPRCGSDKVKQVGDCPAGNWWTECTQCHLPVSEWDHWKSKPSWAQQALPKGHPEK